MKQLQLTSDQYNHLVHSFRQWLTILGYAKTTTYNLPNQLIELLHHLEKQNTFHFQDITNAHIQSYFQTLTKRANQRRKGELSTSYLKKHLQTVNLFLKYLRVTHNIHLNPTLHIPKNETHPVTFLTRQEIQSLYNACNQDIYGIRDKAILSTFYGCAVRRSEGEALNIEDLYFRKRLLHVRQAKGLRERLVPLHKAVIEDIETYLEYSRPYLLKPHITTNALFISQRGGRMQSQSIAKRLKQLIKTCNREHLQYKSIGLHTLRHSLATHMHQRGADITFISQFLGHTSMESTQIYIHLSVKR